MSTGPGRRALSFAYLVPYSVLAACLISLGFVLEGALPASLAGRYRRRLLSMLSTLARPVDGLMGGTPEPVGGGVAGESAP